ncbi:ADP-ribosylglycohydrolase [Mariniphaga anaerophila]|uniref:ADP-ribosylglycohydrolase n=1 Tax=Mariniphaga anaerophila TaxID=1484053 RepID=A0A1M5FCG4_9BACT|nr:ADP-ribosylglycohydrolase family protein [Mariniphaga anaerophila]SHF89283.1 ADP-ribosylglycohydrolase [Mariniphaga anaerophila]
MKINLFIGIATLLFAVSGCNSGTTGTKPDTPAQNQKIKISKADLQDKIKGGWAGQVIGCTYGGPTEFKWLGTMINDEVPIPWDENQLEFWYDQFPGLYDDVYMDLTFVSVFEEHGLDAPDTLHALAFANAGYPLWHANQAARYNILNGIMPPQSGHYFNNPHADDIDFQIESDFAGLMSPGMINASSEICDRIGHIMNYGDGWYGGVFVAGMYTQAFISDNMEFIVTEALKAIPHESRFYQIIADVIKWHKMYPNDWKQNWFEIQKKWSFEKGCPDGVFNAFNIDASLNAAYIVLGLLYGESDYGKTIDISTRAGQDSDCNPSNAAGILGTMLGYSNIPDYWKQGLDRVEHRDFSFTELSLIDTYELGYKHALQMIENHGGQLHQDSVEIAYQTVSPVKMEQSFENLYPEKRLSFEWPLSGKVINNSEKEIEIQFEGAGIVLSGGAVKTDSSLPDHNLKLDVFINDKLGETISLPTQSLIGKTNVYWNYRLEDGPNSVKLVATDVPKGYQVNIYSALIYSKEN